MAFSIACRDFVCLLAVFRWIVLGLLFTGIGVNGQPSRAQDTAADKPVRSEMRSIAPPLADPVDGIAHAEAIMVQLEQVGNWDFSGKTAKDIAAKISKQFQFNVWLDDDVGQHQFHDSNANTAGLHHGITAADALTLTLAPLDLSWSIAHGSLVIIVEDEYRFGQAFLSIHDVTFAFQEIIDQGLTIDANIVRVLLDQIKTLNSPDDWDDASGDSSIEYLPYTSQRVLIALKGPGPLQRQVRVYLRRLKAELQVNPTQQSDSEENSGQSDVEFKPAGADPFGSADNSIPKSPAVTEKQLLQEIQRNNEFTLNWLQRTFLESPKNTTISGLNLRELLALLAVGAEGPLQTDVMRVLHWTGETEEGLQRLAALRKRLTFSMRGMGDSPLSIQSGLWLDQSVKPTELAREWMSQYFGMRPITVDFNKYPDAASTVNTWVEAQTRDLIKELMPPTRPPVPNPILFFGCNTVHFEANWETPFSGNQTAYRPFHTPDAGTVNLLMMEQLATQARYGESNGVQILDLPLKHGRYKIIFVLPPAEKDLPSFVKELTTNSFRDWERVLRRQNALVQIPRLKWQQDHSDMASILASLGVFSEGEASPLNFSGFGAPECAILLPLLKTALDLDEKGIKAASVAGAMVGGFGGGMPEPAKFIADRPFVFYVADAKSDCLVMMGCCLNPEAKN